MFENAGEKIKILASVIFMLSATLFILIFMGYLTQGELLSGIFILGLGIIGAWIASLFMYAFGELVENSKLTTFLLHDILDESRNIYIELLEDKESKSE